MVEDPMKDGAGGGGGAGGCDQNNSLFCIKTT